MELLLKLGVYPWLCCWSCVGNWVRDRYILIMPSIYVLLVTSSCPKRILEGMKRSLIPHLWRGILSVVIVRMANQLRAQRLHWLEFLFLCRQHDQGFGLVMAQMNSSRCLHWGEGRLKSTWFSYLRSVLSPDERTLCPLTFLLGEIVGKHGRDENSCIAKANPFCSQQYFYVSVLCHLKSSSQKLILRQVDLTGK